MLTMSSRIRGIEIHVESISTISARGNPRKARFGAGFTSKLQQAVTEGEDSLTSSVPVTLGGANVNSETGVEDLLPIIEEDRESVLIFLDNRSRALVHLAVRLSTGEDGGKAENRTASLRNRGPGWILSG